MVQKLNETLMRNSGKLVEIKGVVIHNDSGSMTPQQYINWLRHRNKDLGIAHYYINRDCIARVVDTYNIAYHTGNWSSNQRYIGYEVCQSLSASDQDFLANEDMTLMQATEDLIFYKLPINEHTVRLHHEFVPTSCPHRSMKLHGNSTTSVKKYFIERMKHFSTLGKTVDEMLANINKQSVTPKQELQPQVGLKSLDEVAREVLNGRWGNGRARIQNLTQAGYDATKVQERVNQIKGTSTKKTVDEVAREVLNGKWGNGQDRINRLRNAGYNPQEIQNRVNQLVR